MKTKDLMTQSKQTWFGLSARVRIGPGFIHRTGVGRFVIPHPPMANWLLRLGLPDSQRRNLIFAHEFAHFQTAPVLLVYMLVLIVILYVNGRIDIQRLLYLLVSGQAAWEIMSEILVVFENSATYHRSYNGVTRLPRILFWVVGVMFAVVGWIIVLHR